MEKFWKFYWICLAAVAKKYEIYVAFGFSGMELHPLRPIVFVAVA